MTLDTVEIAGGKAMRPKILAGVGVVAALLFGAGIVAVTWERDRDPVTAVSSTTAFSRPQVTMTPVPLPTTIPESTAGTSTTSTFTTLLPPAARARAGDDFVASAGAQVQLTAYELSDRNQSVVWRQVGGPPVIGPPGRLVGPVVAVTMPPRPATLTFRMTVTGRSGDTASDELRIDVFEAADRAVFVDGEVGDDAAAGTRSAPVRSLDRALQIAVPGDADVYLRAGFDYTASVALSGVTSIYGGYDPTWARFVDVKSRITSIGDQPALTITGAADVLLSSVEIAASGGGAGSTGLDVRSSTTVRIEDSAIRSGEASTGSSVGVRAIDVASLVIERSTVSAGGAGAVPDADDAASTGESAVAGESADGPIGAEQLATLAVTAGGSGGVEGDSGEPGGDGAPGGIDGADGAPGEAGAAGTGGVGGDGGVGTVDGPDAELRGADGLAGGLGADGGPGSGGGGGGGVAVETETETGVEVAFADGGGGGGGGSGGGGGLAGGGGPGGAASIGVAAERVAQLELRVVAVTSGRGGRGGEGGDGTLGGAGGSGGQGAPGAILADEAATSGGRGGHGGGGGGGGAGGQGGGGAGGPSIGLAMSGGGVLVIHDSSIRAGEGGSGAPGGAAGANGAAGTPGGDAPGTGGLPSGAGSGSDGVASSGGDSIGWWTDGSVTHDVATSTIAAGAPGLSGGPGGARGRAIASVTTGTV